MRSCIYCSTQNSVENEFCVECGRPLRQPSPYGEEGKSLPVAAFEEAPFRDSLGRPLAYDADPKSGRAYIPGRQEGSVDKILDYPTSHGPGNRRSADVYAGVGASGGADASGGAPKGFAIGAARAIWADDLDLFIWSPTAPQVLRKSLGGLHLQSGPDCLLAVGWTTFLRCDEGLVAFDGLSGVMAIVSRERFGAMTEFRRRLVAAQGDTVTFFNNEFQPTETKAPFAVHALVGSGATLAVFGASGEIAIWRSGYPASGVDARALEPGASGEWVKAVRPERAGAFAQGWVVNEFVGVRTVESGASRVWYVDPSSGEPTGVSFPIETDGPVSVIPGRSGFDAHRLLGFVGGTDSHVSVYHPGETTSIANRRVLGIPTLGSTVAFVRRGKQESAIVVAVEDFNDRQIDFHFLRDTNRPLPNPLIETPSAVQTWMAPYAEGVIVLTFDGRRTVVTSILLPE